MKPEEWDEFHAETLRHEAQVNERFRKLEERAEKAEAEVERLTGEGVSLSIRRDILEARCEQMERDHAETVAEVERLRVQVATWRKATDNSGLAIAEINRERGEAQDRANAAEAKVRAVKTVRTWRNEDGKDFVFAEDLRAALSDWDDQ